MKKGIKKTIKGVVIVLVCILLLLAAYLVYVKTAVYRLDDALNLDVESRAEEQLKTEDGFTAMTYNIGMGIYSKDLGFFMDGGKEGRAFSESEVLKNTKGAIETLKAKQPDFIFVEETATDCTCNYHINQLVELKEAFAAYDAVYAQNWESPYFIYPFIRPFGKSITGLTMLSEYPISESIRYSLPLEDSFTNFIDLDRCYIKSTVKLEDGKNLILYCIHASAYTAEAETANNQIRLLMDDMLGEYEKGNYVIVGGDWNRNLEGDPEALYGVSVEGYSWYMPIDLSLIPDCFTIVSGLNENAPVLSSRNADGPFNPKTQAQGNIDGFIISDNLILKDAEVIDTGFEYSDHNPVFARFEFKK